MKHIEHTISKIIEAQEKTKKPLAIILAGHNGSGKSTMWRKRLSDSLKIPLINADRLMLSILPEPDSRTGPLRPWARSLRDEDQGWMKVAQEGVQAFVGYAMKAKVPFAFETVFSHWIEREDGSIESKIDLIQDMQKAGYFVVLIFVGLNSQDLSILRVQTRVAENGHAVDVEKLRSRFPKTQKAISVAKNVADSAILVDNSRDQKQAFTTCYVVLKNEILYDIRDERIDTPKPILQWLDIVAKN